MKGTREAVAVVLAALLACVACKATRFESVWEERYIVAARAQDQERWGDAEAHYDQLLEHAPDEGRRRLILYRRALMSEQRGRAQEAMARYEAIWSEAPRDEYGARAMYRHAQLLDARGPAPAGRELRGQLVRRYPAQVAAEHALNDLRRWGVEALTFGAFQELMGSFSADVEGTEFEDYLLFVRGEASEQDYGEMEAALAFYEQVIALDPKGGQLADDAIWRIAQIYQKQERWGEALAYLRRLVKEYQEKSWFIGDYNSEFADEARLQRGRIYKEELQDYDAAAREFELFVREFPHSRLRDDAAWEVVQVRRLQGEQAAFEEALRGFLEDYPESRYARIAREQLGRPPAEEASQ